jgi:hypothetical protein
MNVDVLAQVVNEDKYSKREINNTIWEDINDCPNLAPILHNMKRDILLYKARFKHYWPSKAQRCFILGEFNDTQEIMTYIAVGAMKASSGKPVPIHGVVEYVARRLEGYDDHMDAVRTASELIVVAANCDLYDVISANSSETGSLMIKSNWRLEEHTMQYIADTMYLPPLVCSPRVIVSNTSSGYINPVAESVILKSHNHHSMPTALDALNIANSVPFELDEFILNNYDEQSTKPLDTLEKVNNFQLLKNSSRKVYALMLKLGNKFWFSWRYCKRGRLYTQGYHVNIQSTEYKKALISLSEKQHVKITRSTP